jgi:hypothetical protein
MSPRSHISNNRRTVVSAFLLLVMVGLFPMNRAESVPATAVNGESPWIDLEPGLHYGEFLSPLKAQTGDSIIRVVRIDPHLFSLKLVNASNQKDKKCRTPRQWAESFGLVAAINPSMYQRDFLSSTSLMKTRSHTNNPRLSKDKCILVFDPVDPAAKEVMLIDRECDDFTSLAAKYISQIQSIRMISCKKQNVWESQPKMWSTSAIALNSAGEILFIHVRSPYRMNDLINTLLRLPLALERALYAEGGPEAQLFVRSGTFQLEVSGLFDSGLWNGDSQTTTWPIPNVLGIIRKNESPPQAEQSAGH